MATYKSAPKGATIDPGWSGGGFGHMYAQAVGDTAGSGDAALRQQAAQGRETASALGEQISQGYATAADAAQAKYEKSKDAPGLHKDMAAIHAKGAQNFRDTARAAAARTTSDLATYMVGANAGRNPLAAQQAALTSGQNRSEQMFQGETLALGAEEKAQNSLTLAFDAEMATLDYQVQAGEKSTEQATYEAQKLNDERMAASTDVSNLSNFLRGTDVWFEEGNSITPGDPDQEGAPWARIYAAYEAAFSSMATEYGSDLVLAYMRYAYIMSQGKYSAQDAAHLAGWGAQPGTEFDPSFGTFWGGLDPYDYQGAPVGPEIID